MMSLAALSRRATSRLMVPTGVKVSCVVSTSVGLGLIGVHICHKWVLCPYQINSECLLSFFQLRLCESNSMTCIVDLL